MDHEQRIWLKYSIMWGVIYTSAQDDFLYLNIISSKDSSSDVHSQAKTILCNMMGFNGAF